MFAVSGLESFVNNGVAFFVTMAIILWYLWDTRVPPGMKGIAAGLAEKKGTSLLKKWLS